MRGSVLMTRDEVTLDSPCDVLGLVNISWCWKDGES